MTTAAPVATDPDEARIAEILALADGHYRPMQDMALEYALAGRTVEEFACAAMAHLRFACKATRRVVESAESAASVSLEKTSTP